jgi:hypothetical protein
MVGVGTKYVMVVVYSRRWNMKLNPNATTAELEAELAELDEVLTKGVGEYHRDYWVVYMMADIIRTELNARAE